MDRVIARQMLFKKKLEKEEKETEEKLRGHGRQEEEQRIKRDLEEKERLKLEVKQRLEAKKIKLHDSKKSINLSIFIKPFLGIHLPPPTITYVSIPILV